MNWKMPARSASVLSHPFLRNRIDFSSSRSMASSHQPLTRLSVVLLIAAALATAVVSAYAAAETANSIYVPLDSWVYAAFDRLAALGYASSAYSGMRPWTRGECA